MTKRTNKGRAAKAVTALAVAGGLIAPAATTMAAPGDRGNGLSLTDERYVEVRQDYVDDYGVKAAGRNILRDGFLEKDGDVRPATEGEIKRSLEVMKPEPAPAPAATAEAATESSSSTGAASATVMCESGGDYAADTGNGYYGGYQFDSGTWDAYGDPAYAEASDAPPEVQDAAAASVPYDAWPNCP
jgi:hypothetical protein